MADIKSIQPVQLILSGHEIAWVLNAVIHGVVGDQQSYRYTHAMDVLRDSIQRAGPEMGAHLFIKMLEKEYGEGSVPDFALPLIKHVAVHLSARERS
jgi:hypothetical protein